MMTCEQWGSVEIVRLGYDSSSRVSKTLECKVIQVMIIGFEMEQSVRFEYLTIEGEKPWVTQSPFGIMEFGSRVGMYESEFIHFTWMEKMREMMDDRTQKSYIDQMVTLLILKSMTETITFDIYTDEVATRKNLGQSCGVFTATTC